MVARESFLLVEALVIFLDFELTRWTETIIVYLHFADTVYSLTSRLEVTPYFAFDFP